MELFQKTAITKNVFRIDTPYGVAMYFVQGKDRGVLIDTGMGVGSLRTFLKSVTSLPYDVYLTHGHCDHAGGASEFDEVYLNPKDWELEKQHAAIEHRIDDVFRGPFPVPEGTEESMFIPQRKTEYLPYDENDVLDLGDYQVRFIAVPGHTKGCMVPVFVEDRMAVIGDALGEMTLLQFPESTSIEEYRKSLEHLQEEETEFDQVLRFHGTCESDKQIIEDSIELCEEILEGKDAEIPAEVHDYPGRLGRPEKHPGKEGNILYNPESIKN